MGSTVVRMVEVVHIDNDEQPMAFMIELIHQNLLKYYIGSVRMGFKV